MLNPCHMEFAALRFIINIHLTQTHINLPSTQFGEPHIKRNGCIQYKEIPVFFLTIIVMILFDCIDIKIENSSLQFAFFLHCDAVYFSVCRREYYVIFISTKYSTY